MRSLKIIILGSAASKPSKERWTQSIVVMTPRTAVLIDAGEAVQIRLQEADIDPVHLDAIFLTHKHGDHLWGLMPLLDTLNTKIENEKIAKSLRLYIPSDVEPEILNILNRYRYVILNTISPLTPIIVGDLEVSAIPLNHGNILSYGFHIRYSNREKRKRDILILGDGTCSETCSEYVQGLRDLVVIAEATFLCTYKDLILAQRSAHSSLNHVAELLGHIKDVKIVILTHLSHRYGPRDYLDSLYCVRRYFAGPVVVAEDLMTVVV